MKLLVIAATGNLGKAIVNAALRDGHDVSVLVRDGTKVPWNGEQLTKVYVSASGSLGDQVAIASAGDTLGAHSFHRTQPDVIDESVVGASLLYEAVAQAFLDVGEELVKKGAKSAYNHKRVAFKGGGEMSCYELCMTTLIGCPCV